MSDVAPANTTLGSTNAKKGNARKTDRPVISAEAMNQLDFDSDNFDRLTHYLFRYPAKFHPPVVRKLLSEHTSPGDRVLDPFCGSGTLLVEAANANRSAIGSDIDPLAVFVSKVKTHHYNVGHLKNTAESLRAKVAPHRRDDSEYERRQWPGSDIGKEEMQEVVGKENLWVPKILNLYHWFRKYVIVDLARIIGEIRKLDAPETHRDFFRLCFASIIRSSSNADPVPVSGLEYTAHMRAKDEKGRIINPFQLLDKALDKNISATKSFSEKASSDVRTVVRKADVLELSDFARKRRWKPIDVIITSPPYHSAVDYYRRHQLEMFWLGMTETQKDRLAMKHDYVGRPSVKVGDPFVSDSHALPPRSKRWHEEMHKVAERRARAFKHYTVSMRKSLEEMARVLESGAKAILVVGHSTWNEKEIPTKDLLLEMTSDTFRCAEVSYYPLKNRYMSYDRHNDADIDKEYVIVLERR